MENFTITIDSENYNVKPIDEVDQILYEIKKQNQLITLIGLNEDGEWEANNDYDEAIVKKFGDAIESYTS